MGKPVFLIISQANVIISGYKVIYGAWLGMLCTMKEKPDLSQWVEILFDLVFVKNEVIYPSFWHCLIGFLTYIEGMCGAVIGWIVSPKHRQTPLKFYLVWRKFFHDNK